MYATKKHKMTKCTYTVQYLGQCYTNDLKHYEKNEGIKGGKTAPEAKVTIWAFDDKRTQEDASKIVDNLSQNPTMENGIIVRVAFEKQTVAATLFTLQELIQKLKEQQYIICYHPWNYQAWKVTFQNYEEKTVSNMSVTAFMSNLFNENTDKTKKTVEILTNARNCSLETTEKIWNLLENMSKENTTLVNRLDTHGRNFQAPITKLPCTLSPLFENECKKQSQGVRDFIGIEMPYSYMYYCLEHEAKKFNEKNEYYWPLQEIVELAFGIISMSHNISGEELQPIFSSENINISNGFECLAEFLSLHVADKHNYKYKSDLWVTGVCVKTKDDEGEKHQIFTDEDKCELEFEWGCGEMQERGNDPHDCEDIAAKTAMIFLTLLYNIHNKEKEILLQDVKNKCKNYGEENCKIITNFLKHLAKIASGCEIYMITGTAGAPSLEEHYNADSQNMKSILKYIADWELGGHEYAVLCSKEEGKGTILETTGWTMVNVYKRNPETEKNETTCISSSIAENDHVTQRMVCNINWDQPGTQFWRDAFCANSKLFFTTLGSEVEKMGLDVNSKRCAKYYGAPIEAILARLISDENEYPDLPVSADYVETLDPENEKMKNLADAYILMNQPLIEEKVFFDRKVSKWVKKERVATKAEWLEIAKNARENKDIGNMIFSTKEISGGVPFMNGWLGWRWETLEFKKTGAV